MTERLLQNHLQTYLQHKLVFVPVKIQFVNGKKEPHFPVHWGKLEDISPDIFIDFVFPQLSFDDATHVAILLRPCGLCVFDFDDTKNMPTDFVQQVIDYAERESIPFVRSGRGIHLYFKLSEAASQLPSRIEIGGGWLEVKRSGVIFAPLFDGVSDYYRWIIPIDDGNLRELTEKDLQYLLPQNPIISLTPSASSWEEVGENNEFADIFPRRLSDEEINEIVNLLLPYYYHGNRNNLILALSGLLRKAGVSFDDALRVVEKFIEITNDEERRNRIDELIRTYAKPPEAVAGFKSLIRYTGGNIELAQKIWKKVRCENINITDEYIATFATPRWWGRQVAKYIANNYISLLDSKNRSTLVYRFDPSRFIWEFVPNFTDEIVDIIDTLADEWEKFITSLDIDGKIKTRMITKLANTDMRKVARQYVNKLSKLIAVSADEFYRYKEKLCEKHPDQRLNNIVATNEHFLFIYECGCIETISKSEVKEPQKLKVLTYIDASLSGDPQAARDFFYSYGDDLGKSLLRMAAYCVLARTNFKRRIFLLTGVTSSGKTTITQLLRCAVNQKANVFYSDALLERGDAQHAVRASMASDKIAIFTELPPSKLAASQLKTITDEGLPGRLLYSQPATYFNISIPIITTNYIPHKESIDAAVAERFEIFVFTKMFKNNNKIAQFYHAEEVKPAVPYMATRLWERKNFRDSFLAAIMEAWRDLCQDDFRFVLDDASEKINRQVVDEILSVDAFSQFLEVDYSCFFPSKFLYHLYILYCSKKRIVGVQNADQFGRKLKQTQKGQVAQMKKLKSYKHPFVVKIAEKLNIPLPEKYARYYSLKPSEELLKFLGWDDIKFDDVNVVDDELIEAFDFAANDDDDDEEEIYYNDIQQPLTEVFPLNETMKEESENEETSTPIQIPQNCANCGNELIVKKNELICEHCNATIYFDENTIVEVDEDQIPQNCLICGNQIDLNEDNECENCKIIYRIRFNFPF